MRSGRGGGRKGPGGKQRRGRGKEEAAAAAAAAAATGGVDDGIGDGWNSGVQQSSEEPTAAVSTMSRDMQALLKNFEQGSQLQELRKSLANSQQSLMHSESFINQASQEWFK